MKDIPVQLHSTRRTTIGDNLITFRIDEMYVETLSELMLKKIGTEFIMKLEDVTTGVTIGGDKPNNDTKDKFFRQLHAKLREHSERTGVAEDDVKIGLWTKLRKRGIDVQSSKELDIKGLAIAIGIMSQMLDE